MYWLIAFTCFGDSLTYLTIFIFRCAVTAVLLLSIFSSAILVASSFIIAKTRDAVPQQINLIV